MLMILEGHKKMETIKQVIGRQLDFNLRYAQQLVADIPAEMMAHAPSDGLASHPAFTIGHLVTAAAMIVEDLGGDMDLPQGWGDIFMRKGPDDQTRASVDVAIYPGKSSLLNELERQHDRVKQYLASKEDAEFCVPVKWRFAHYLPSLLDVVLFFSVNHEAMHLGQLAAWRRAMNLPPALRQL